MRASDSWDQGRRTSGKTERKPTSDRNEQLGVLPVQRPSPSARAAGEGRVSASEEEIVVFVLTNKASALSLPFLLPCPNTYIFFKDHLAGERLAVEVWTSANTSEGRIAPSSSTAFVPLACPT